MDRMIYLSMAGAKATMQRQDALAHNLANASTPGFRAEMTAFRAVPVLGDGASTRVYALESTPGYNAEPGAVQPTGRNLDVALKGNAWLAVQGLDGTEAYTRAGSLDTRSRGPADHQDRSHGARRRRADHDPRQRAGADRARRHRQRRGGQRQAADGGQAEAGDARGAAAARRRRPVPRRRRRPAAPTPTRACKTVRSRAAT